MKSQLIIAFISTIIITSCDPEKSEHMNQNMKATDSAQASVKSGYADLNGFKMYYEIYGNGEPMVPNSEKILNL